jgi:hypothetical protein
MDQNNFWDTRKILPSITTINGSLWKNKIEEVKKLRLKEVFLFLTSVKEEKRKELYELLKNTEVEIIPLVHIREDMNLWELDYLVKEYKVEAFNIHNKREYPFSYDYSKYKNMIYIENTILPLKEEEIKEFAGICLDLSHLEGSKTMRKEIYENDIKLIEKYPIGCNHISGVEKDFSSDKEHTPVYDKHFIDDLSELDYLKNYPRKYFSNLIAIELENSIEDQLKARSYIFNLLKFD